MSRYLRILLATGLVTVLVGSAASAATIQDVLNKTLPFDPTTTNFVDLGFGLDGCWLTIPQDQFDTNTNLFKSGARPTATAWFYSPNKGGGGGGGGSSNSNPAALIFKTVGIGPVGSDMVSSYQLGNNLGGTWSMDFSMLIYDPGFTGSEIDLALKGTQDTQYSQRRVAPAEVLAGKMVTWHIDGAAGEAVDVIVDAVGGESYAAGFFMGNSNFFPPIFSPEPATLCLMGLGLVGLALRRRK